MPEDNRSDGAGPFDETTDRVPVNPESEQDATNADRTVRLGGDLHEANTERNTVAGAGGADSEATQSIPVVSESDAQRTRSISDTEQTRSIPPVRDVPRWPGTAETAAGPPADPPQPPQPPAPPGESPEPRGNRRGLVRAGIVAAAVVGVLALLYIGDIALSSGKVPRGTVVAGVEIGGMSKQSAEEELRERLGPALHEPIEVSAGDSTATIDPDRAGLRMDWAATVERAGSQSLNPFTRVTSLFSTRDVVPASHGDRESLAKALHEIKPKLDRESVEGGIRFEGTTPVAIEPVTGREVNVPGATDTVLAEWAGNHPIPVPFSERPVSTTEEGVQRALTEIAEPAVSGPVTVRGEGVEATLTPEVIARNLSFKPDGRDGLQPDVNVPGLAKVAQPQLGDTIVPGRDAKIVLEGGTPTVQPSVDGRGVDWERSFQDLTSTYRETEDRSVRAVYQQQPAKFTTEQANQLGIKEKVSEFTTEGFEEASGVNIKRVAEEVNGAIVKPGETFSLNGHTGPRTKADGYVESGIIEDGRPSKAVGGGISQFATTLYNASYFAGMRDVEHKEHSYYISRYPEGREATVYQNPDGSSVIDVKFKNTSDNAIMINTSWDPSSITIEFWGTKQYEVTSDTSERSNPTPPEEKVVPPGEPCSASSGAPGFTVYDTRTLKNLKTGNVTREEPSRTVYDPQPIIHCDTPPPPGPPA